MSYLNKVILIGNLTRDPQLRYTPGGAAVCDLGLAINHNYTTKQGERKDEVCFVDITTWGRQAETCNDYLRKGSSVMIEGRLKFDQWQDRETNKNRTKLTVTANNVQFLGSPASSGSNNQQYNNSNQPQQPQQQQPPRPPAFNPHQGNNMGQTQQNNNFQQSQQPAPPAFNNTSPENSQQTNNQQQNQVNPSANKPPTPPPFTKNEEVATEDNIPF
ncbi:MAG: single-stranded DNA-binding protein [Verrucomicrobiota bacterium]|nr:single-stranded DNA-binding protein [Verrucomicrobiota bacterium]